MGAGTASSWSTNLCASMSVLTRLIDGKDFFAERPEVDRREVDATTEGLTGLSECIEPLGSNARGLVVGLSGELEGDIDRESSNASPLRSLSFLSATAARTSA
jgi:hypothetical protein